jgi:hypothetical protein
MNSKKSCVIVMYKYTFILNNGQQDHVVGDMFRNVLADYFQWRAMDLLGGVMLQGIEVRGYPTSKGKAYHVDAKLIEQIVDTLKQQNVPVDTQKERCEDMKKTCPDGSKDVDPIMQYEDWCDDVPYQEFVKNNEYLSQCYRLSNLLSAFKAGLEVTKNKAPMPQCPVDPISGVGISAETLQTLYKQAQDANLEIPELFIKFMNALDAGLFDVEAAMKGQYVGITDKISMDYRKGFIEPAVDLLFSVQQAASPSSTEQTQEEQDLQMAIQLAAQIGYQ